MRYTIKPGTAKLKDEAEPFADGETLVRVLDAATIVGTSGADFIHVAGDGHNPRPGYNKIVYTPSGSTNVIETEGGPDHIYGSDDSEIVRLTVPDSLNYLHFYGGSGYDKLELDVSGLTAYGLHLRSVEEIDLVPTGSSPFEMYFAHRDLSDVHSFIASGDHADDAVKILNLAQRGETIIHYADADLTGLDVINGARNPETIDIVALLSDGLTVNGGHGDDIIHLSFRKDSPSHGGAYTINGGGDGDTLSGGRGTFLMFGENGRDTLHGGNRDDILDGGRGKDILDGRGGADQLTGGDGYDLFQFKSVADSTSSVPDTITDFSHRDGDLIDLSKIDADTSFSGKQAFHLVPGGTFTDHAGELIQVNDGNDNTLVEGDVDGDGQADLVIVLNHAPVLVQTDFVL